MTSSDTEDFSLPATVETINSLEKTINDLGIYTRRADAYPFDTVAGEMLCKAFALSRSALLLTEQGYPDEAFGLCRSLYDLSMSLRYITQEPEMRNDRARKFLKFGITSKAFWFDLLDKNASLTQPEREDLQRYKAENNIPDDPKRIKQPWSEVQGLPERITREAHPADASISTEGMRLKEKAIAWTDASCYVHCTQPGLNSYTFELGELIVIRQSRAVRTSTPLKTHMMIETHLRVIVRYCLLGMAVFSLAQLKVGESVANDTSRASDTPE